MDFEAILNVVRMYWTLILFFGSIFIAGVLAMLRNRFATREELTSVKNKVEHIDQKTTENSIAILSIKKDIEKLPTAKQVSDIEVNIGRLEEQSKANGSMLKTIHDALIGAEGKKS